MGLWNRLGRRKEKETDASVDAEEEARVAGLALSLESEDIVARWRAVRALGEIGDAAVLPLMKGLGDEDWCVRREAAAASAGWGRRRSRTSSGRFRMRTTPCARAPLWRSGRSGARQRAP